LDDLKTKCAYLNNQAIVVALSGGVDSTALLHWLHQQPLKSLRAVYVNHHLSTKSQAWDVFCQKLCANWGINYTCINVFLKNEQNIEENARKLRYQAIFSQLKTNEWLCTAHHQDDQAETLLLQLFRGSGSAGLSAMPQQRNFNTNKHCRPLLSTSKQAILTYAKHHQLNWIEDDSNQNTHFRRNFLRKNIIPQLQLIYPTLSKTIYRATQHQQEAHQLSQELAKIDIETNQLITSTGHLDTQKLSQFSAHRLKNILRYHLTTLKFLMPSEAILTQILAVIEAKPDAKPLVCWSDYELRRYQYQLYFIDTRQNKPNECPLYDRFKHQTGFNIRYRQGAERVHLPNKNHSQSLKKILQSACVPPWERNTLRMYYLNNELQAMEKIGLLQIAKPKFKDLIAK
jgi:tRNA(Ile)-lysidine synthase